MMTDADALQLARDAEKGSTSYFDANIRPNLERDIRQFHSKHNPDSKYASDAYRSRSRFYRPKTRSMVRNGEATAAEAFFSTADVVSVSPEDERDEMQKVSAEIMLELLNYRLKKTVPWFQTVIGGYQDAMVQGTVISHQGWEWDQAKKIDKPVITLIPLENFRFDPAADWTDPVNSSPYCIWLIPMYVKDIEKRMRDGKWKAIDRAKILSAAKKWDSTRMLREDNRMNSADAVTSITAFTIVWVHLNVMIDDETGEDVMYYTLGSEFMLSSPEPLTNQYAHGKRPFVIGKSVIETHKNWSSGPVRLARETIAELNDVANARMDNVKFAMNKRYFAARNKQVDIRSLTRNVPGSVTLMEDPEKDVHVVQTPDVTSSSYQEQDRLNMEFDEVTGSMSQSSVQANRKLNETVGGLEMADAGASKVQNYQLKTFIETWVEPVLSQLILLEQCYETDETILALAAGKSALFQKMGFDQVTDDLLAAELTMEVSVGMAATSPAQKINNLMTGIRGVKEALADGTLEKYGVDPVEVIKEVFGALGHKDGGRFFKADQDPQVQALQSQIQTMQQALDAKHPPELLAAMVQEIEAKVEFLKKQGAKVDADKVAAGVTSTYSAMQAAEVIAAVPQVAPIADKIMQAAGYQVPTPGGVDPNFPDGSQIAGGPVSPNEPLAPAAAEAVQAGPVEIAPSGNSSPMLPGKAPSPGQGAQDGIETQRNDGVQPGVAGQ